MSIYCRSNSKTTYLTRPIHEKHLANPDHGSYKPTTMDNCFNNVPYATEILQTKSNLPDVLPLAVKFSNSNDRFMSNVNLNNQTNQSSNKQKAMPQSAPIISANNLKSFFNFSRTQIPSNDHDCSRLNDALYPKHTQSSFDLHQTHFMETFTQPYTKEALLNLTHQRDDPPPYTAEIEREVIQRLEFIQPSNALIVSSEKVNEKTPLFSEPALDIKAREVLLDKINPPQYEITLNQIQFPDISENWNYASETLDKDTDQKASSPLTPKSSFISSPSSDSKNILPQLPDVSTKTNEVASQTEESSSRKISLSSVATAHVSNQSTYKRRVLPEEIDCENLSKDLVSQLSPFDKLHHLLGKFLATLILKTTIK